MIIVDNGFLTTGIIESCAAELISCTTKTISRYKEPANRNPALWELLELKALEQILPPAWKAKVCNGTLITETGYKIGKEQLNQYGWHLSTINQMGEEIRTLRQRLNELKKEAPQPASNVIEFPKQKHGDIPA